MGSPGNRAVEKMLESIRDERLAKQDQQIVDASARFEAGYAAGYREGLRQAGWLEDVVAAQVDKKEVVQLVKLDGTVRRWRRVGSHPYREAPETEAVKPAVAAARRLSAIRWCIVAALGGLAVAFAASALPHAHPAFPLGATLYVFIGTLAGARAFLGEPDHHP